MHSVGMCDCDKLCYTVPSVPGLVIYPYLIRTYARYYSRALLRIQLSKVWSQIPEAQECVAENDMCRGPMCGAEAAEKNN